MECADEDASFAEDFLFSHFPSLLHVRLTLTDCNSALKYAVTKCHQLKYLFFENDFVNDISLVYNNYVCSCSQLICHVHL